MSSRLTARLSLRSCTPVLFVLLAACGIAAPDAHEPRVALLDSAWELTAIDGRPVAAGPAPTLAIDAAGGVSGDAGCNRYFGSAEVDDGAAAFASLGATRRACADAERMAQETRFLEALGTVAAYRAAGDGRLVLLSADGRPRLAFRALEPARPAKLVFRCDSGRRVTLEQRGADTVELVFDGTTRQLERVTSASGARYEAPGLVFFTKGDEALLELDGEADRCATRGDPGGPRD